MLFIYSTLSLGIKSFPSVLSGADTLEPQEQINEPRQARTFTLLSGHSNYFWLSTTQAKSIEVLSRTFAGAKVDAKVLIFVGSLATRTV